MHKKWTPVERSKGVYKVEILPKNHPQAVTQDEGPVKNVGILEVIELATESALQLSIGFVAMAFDNELSDV